METPWQQVAEKLDFAFSYANYHDEYDMPVNRKLFLSSVKGTLKPEGIYIVIDHYAVEGSSSKYSGSNTGLHSVDKSLVLKEILTTGNWWTTPTSSTTKPTRSPQVKTDRFALKFRKAQE